MIIYEIQLGPRQYAYYNIEKTIAYICIGYTHPNARQIFHANTPHIKHKDYCFLG